VGVFIGMEDKTFELMTKMYSEFTDRFNKMDDRFDKMDDRFDKMDVKFYKLTKDMLNFENNLSPKVEALLDGYKQIYEKQLEHDKRFDAHDQRFDSLENVIRKHDIEIRVIKGGANT